MKQSDWARRLARTLLEEPFPRRWAHTQGVARQARSLAPILGNDADPLEAEERGLADELLEEFASPREDLFEALVYSDMTTTPHGHVTSVADRISEIQGRYPPTHLVSRFITRATPRLATSVAAVESMTSHSTATRVR